MLTIKGKIILASILVFGATLLVFAFLVYDSSKQAELAKLDARLETHAEKLETEIEEQLDEGLFPALEDLHDVTTEGLPIVLVQIWDSSGHLVVRDSVLNKLTTAPWRHSRTTDTTVEYLTDHHQRYRCHWYPVEVEEGVPLVAQIAAPLTDVEESLGYLRVLFWVSIPAALLLIGLAAYLITRTAFRPLTRMAAAAEDISGINLEERLELPAARDEVRSLAETLNRMIERIEAAFRSQRQFVADASHEIRTPLTIITSELEYAQKATSPTLVQESIDVALSEIDRLNHMVEGLLLLARLDSTQTNVNLQEFRLDELVVETVQLMRRLAQTKNLNLDLYVQDAVEITADHDMVRRAVINVLENAVKYSPDGAPVFIKLYAISEHTGRVVLEIEDRGPGIAPADQLRVFERFYRSPEARPDSNGSGLGLAIAKKLVELNGGRILLQSALGRGTKITIELRSGRAH